MTKTNPGRFVLRVAGIALVLGSAGPVMGQTAVATGVGTPFELAFWQSIDSSNDASLYDAYLTHFPNGTFGEIARVKIVSLRGRVSAPVTPALTVPVAPSATLPVATPIAQPTPAAVRLVQPATAVVEPIPAAAPAVAAPVAAPQVVAASAVASAPPAAGTLGQLLAALATSQASEAGGQAVSANAAQQPATLQSATLVSGPAVSGLAIGGAAPAPAAQRQSAVSFVIPAQPALYPVPSVAFPPSFCSAEQRNAFHDQVYAPSVNTARRNNEAAAAYLRQLQGLYDQYQMSRDPDTMNAIVVAARTYEQVAQTTFSMQAGLVRQFGALMAVPVVACAQTAQPLNAVLVK